MRMRFKVGKNQMSFCECDRGAPQMESSKSILKPYPDPMMTLGCHRTQGSGHPH